MGKGLAELSAWLRVRHPEIERTTLARICGVSDPASARDPQYVAGLGTAVSDALNYALVGVECGEGGAGPIPRGLLTQARHAARKGVSLDTVLRRYFAGYAVLSDFIIQAAHENPAGWEDAVLQRAWRTETAIFDRLISAVVAEYTDETEERAHNAEQRAVERVRRLLAGQFLDSHELQYELDAWHIGAIAVGPDALPAIQGLASRLDRRLLLVRPDGETIWAWLGGQRKVATQEALHLAMPLWPAETILALGEPRRGLPGWRLTHRQALAAISVALRQPPNLIRYTDVALLAAALQDEVLARSLEGTYLDPLTQERDSGVALRQTLSAYFAAGRNVSSAAAALGLSRQTVNSRLRTIEERIGYSLNVCAAEMETALRLREHDARPLYK